MPKKKVNYRNGFRGCFVTFIKWPLIGTGLVCLFFILYVTLETLYPKMDHLLLSFLAGLGGAILMRILAYCVRTFLEHATADDESGTRPAHGEHALHPGKES